MRLVLKRTSSFQQRAALFSHEVKEVRGLLPPKDDWRQLCLSVCAAELRRQTLFGCKTIFRACVAYAFPHAKKSVPYREYSSFFLNATMRAPRQLDSVPYRYTLHVGLVQILMTHRSEFWCHSPATPPLPDPQLPSVQSRSPGHGLVTMCAPSM